MQVKELENKGLKRSFQVVVDAARINAQMEVELKAAGERVKIPGFRPGNIPLKVLKQRYGKTVQPEVFKNVIGRATTEILAEKKLRPAMAPEISIDEYKDDGDLTYTASFELFPDVPEVKFDKIKLDRSVFDIGDKDIEETLNSIAERTPSFTRAKEGAAAKMGQVVTIDFKGMIDGKAFAGGSATNFKLELGSKQFIEGFEAQLVGAKEGDDRIVNVTFPKDYGSDKLAGQDATFAVTVKEIADKTTPAVDDAFAKQHGFADLAAFQNAVRERMTHEYGQVVRQQLKKSLFDALEEEYDFTLPQGMVDVEFKSIWEQLQEAKRHGDPSLRDKSDEELKAEYEDIARRRVRLGIVLADVGRRNNIQVTREEIGRAVLQQASQYSGQENKVIEFYRNHPERAEDLRGPILEEKAVDFILRQVSYNDKKITLQQLADSNNNEEDDAASQQESKPKTKNKKKKAE